MFMKCPDPLNTLAQLCAGARPPLGGAVPLTLRLQVPRSSGLSLPVAATGSLLLAQDITAHVVCPTARHQPA